MEQIYSWADKVISYWKSKGIKLQNGISLTTISESENIIGFRFPMAFIKLYKKVNGFEDWSWNEYMFSVWPLEKIVEEYHESNDKNFISFCDYLINSHCIGFLKEHNGVFKDYNQTKPISSTFQEVIELINTDSKLIY